MIEIEEAIRICSPLVLLRGFPWQPEALAAVGRLVQSLVRDDAEAIWLVDHMIGHYDEWPGPAALVRAYTARYAPREASVAAGACAPHGVTGCPICRGSGAPAQARVQ